jgi:hypothetical protein
MKKIFTLAAILFSVTTFAAERPGPAKISVSNNARAIIQVKIDGRNYNLDRNTFALNNIKPGYHTIEIYRFENRGMFRTKAKTIYSSSMYIAPGQLVDIDINRFGNVEVSKRGGMNGRNDRDGRYDSRGRDNDWGNRDNDRDGRNGRF